MTAKRERSVYQLEITLHKTSPTDKAAWPFMATVWSWEFASGLSRAVRQGRSSNNGHTSTNAERFTDASRVFGRVTLRKPGGGRPSGLPSGPAPPAELASVTSVRAPPWSGQQPREKSNAKSTKAQRKRAYSAGTSWF